MSILRDLGTPVFKAEGAPRIDRTKYVLKITGLVELERELTWKEILELPTNRLSSRLTSVSGWSVRADWDGIRWKDFLTVMAKQSSLVTPVDENVLHPGATHAIFTGYGEIYTTTVSLIDLEAPRVMLVTGVAGDPLEAEYGGPLRMVIPNLYGYKSCKWLTRIEFINRMEGGYWEDRGYSRSGIIEPGTTFDVNSKTHKEIKGGEVVDF